ncbi:hypothetical protein FA95DRAFT_1574793 [Auriscalpium vulgare]|uniref:Uncharacterized protein n=1 Tax=Auriscalpium vulgare TaxID=40419 RepID=A0ACB8RID8_9AGAM|nr:hypothetical protein FA95DRAFT_1574793 [Auriscalpium vulgare]
MFYLRSLFAFSVLAPALALPALVSPSSSPSHSSRRGAGMVEDAFTQRRHIHLPNRPSLPDFLIHKQIFLFTNTVLTPVTQQRWMILALRKTLSEALFTPTKPMLALRCIQEVQHDMTRSRRANQEELLKAIISARVESRTDVRHSSRSLFSSFLNTTIPIAAEYIKRNIVYSGEEDDAGIDMQDDMCRRRGIQDDLLKAIISARVKNELLSILAKRPA